MQSFKPFIGGLMLGFPLMLQTAHTCSLDALLSMTTRDDMAYLQAFNPETIVPSSIHRIDSSSVFQVTLTDGRTFALRSEAKQDIDFSLFAHTFLRKPRQNKPPLAPPTRRLTPQEKTTLAQIADKNPSSDFGIRWLNSRNTQMEWSITPWYQHGDGASFLSTQFPLHHAFHSFLKFKHNITRRYFSEVWSEATPEMRNTFLNDLKSAYPHLHEKMGSDPMKNSSKWLHQLPENAGERFLDRVWEQLPISQRQDLVDMMTMSQILGYVDLHPGNWVWSRDGRTMAIDLARSSEIFREGKNILVSFHPLTHTESIRGKIHLNPSPSADVINFLKNLTQSELQSLSRETGVNLSPIEINGILNRRDRWLREFHQRMGNPLNPSP